MKHPLRRNRKLFVNLFAPIIKRLSKFPFIHSIRLRYLTSYLIALIIGISLPIQYIIEQTDSILNERAMNAVNNSLNQIANRIDNQISLTESLVYQVVYNNTIREITAHVWNSNDTEERLKQLDDYYYLYDYLPLIKNVSGISNLCIYMTNHPFYIVDQTYIFNESILTGLPVYEKISTIPGGHTWFSRSSCEASFIMGISLSVSRGQINCGYVEAQFDLSSIEKEITETLYNDQYIALMDSENNIIMEAGYQEYVQAVDISSKTSDYYFEYYYGNEKTIMMTFPLSIEGWTLITVIPYKSITSEWAATRLIILLLIFLLVSASIIVSIILSNLFMGRIVRLKNIMENYSIESHSLYLDKPARGDELSLIENTFKQTTIRLNNTLQALYQVKIDKKVFEMKVLQSQINSHFLYNTLDSINWMAFVQGNTDVSNMVSALGRFYRLGLSSGQNIITIHDEIEITKAYLYIQRIRFHEHLVVNYSIPEDIFNYSTIKLILQPVVENSIVHGMSDFNDRIGTLDIHGYIEKGAIIFIIRDNGHGFMVDEYYLPDITKQGNGFGLSNIKERLKLHFGDETSVSVKSAPGQGTEVVLKWPARRFEE